MTPDAPVPFDIVMVMKPAVEDADAPVIDHPVPNPAVEVALSANTKSVETTPVTAQSIPSVEDAAIVYVLAISEHEPASIFAKLVGTTPKLAVFPTEIPYL